jgi:hypothetical protein
MLGELRQLIWLGKTGQNVLTGGLGHGCRLLEISAQVFEHHHKLVTAQACDGIAFAHTSTQALGDLLQQQVANVVAVCVIECLEVVKVDEQQGTFLPVSGE